MISEIIKLINFCRKPQLLFDFFTFSLFVCPKETTTTKNCETFATGIENTF